MIIAKAVRIFGEDLVVFRDEEGNYGLIDRKKIYITNVVNYRPPNNRKPEPHEINRYSNFLR